MSPDKGKAEKKVTRRTWKDPHSWTRKWVAGQVKEEKVVESLSRDYLRFLDICRTEREAVDYWAKRLKEAGFVDLSGKGSGSPHPGKGFFIINRGREIVAGIVGDEDLTSGLSMIASHLDSPRLDLKPLPIDGDPDTGLGLMRTHYYGGIKKYHWVNIPLALHGIIIRESGEAVEVRIGDGEDEPVLVIPDLLPHLSKKVQDTRKLLTGIKGEELVALTGIGPVENEDKDEEDRPKVTLDILSLLNRRYSIVEEDLISADLCLVPAWKPREVGLDRGLIGSYGHDNKVSSYCALRALIDIAKEKSTPVRWCLVVAFDREEVGSDGPTGAKSSFLELSLYRMLEWSGRKGTRKELHGLLSRSFALSADVKSAVNPLFKGVQDPMNSARIGAGVTITKYTGSGGKALANDASAEMVGGIRGLFNSNSIVWQPQETGRVDEGGGGTVAKFLATRNMDVLDCGIPLLSMHSPFEIVSKWDVYMALRAFRTFLEKYRRDREVTA